MNDLSVKLMCIALRGGLEIWAEDEKIQNLKKIIMSSKESKFIELNNEVINTADITGIFEAKTMEEKNLIRNGYWKCKSGNYWHKRGEECGHGRPI